MSEQNKTLMRRMIEDVWNKENYALVDERVASDFIGQSPLREIHGPKEYKQFFSTLHESFPDLHFSIEDMLTDGDKVVARWTVQGSHRGQFQGQPATGKQVTMTGITIGRFVNGKVVEGWMDCDALGLIRQLGSAPIPEPVG